MPPRIQVVSGVILRGGLMLLTQRDPARSDLGMRWETPGGKVDHSDESPSAALRRELAEELGIAAKVGAILGRAILDPPILSKPYEVTFFSVDIGEQTPRPLVHVGLGWFGYAAVGVLPMTPAGDSMRVLFLSMLMGTR